LCHLPCVWTRKKVGLEFWRKEVDNIQTCILYQGVSLTHLHLDSIVLMAAQLSMIQYHFQIIDHGFQETHFLSWIVHKNIKEKRVFYVTIAYRVLGHFLWWLLPASVFSTISKYKTIVHQVHFTNVKSSHSN